MQLVEGERKAVYEDCENEKSDNREKVKKLNQTPSSRAVAQE